MIYRARFPQGNEGPRDLEERSEQRLLQRSNEVEVSPAQEFAEGNIPTSPHRICHEPPERGQGKRDPKEDTSSKYEAQATDEAHHALLQSGFRSRQ